MTIQRDFAFPPVTRRPVCPHKKGRFPGSTVKRRPAMFRMQVMLMTAALFFWFAPADAGLLEKLFAPRARLWDYWTQYEPDSNQKIDHSAWGVFLDTYLSKDHDGISRVDYGGVSSEDRASLEAYIDRMQAVTITRYSRPQQFAYWTNLYNALTIDVVHDHYPVKSIRDIKLSGGLFSAGPWNKKLLEIEGKKVSLNDIEHRILRPIWKDPRIHYALNCASLGCPNLAPVPFTAENSEQLLELGAAEYVNHPRGVQLREGRLWVSSTYIWFEPDFGGGKQGVVEHLIRYAGTALAADLQKTAKISGSDYDWSLNDAP